MPLSCAADVDGGRAQRMRTLRDTGNWFTSLLV